MPNLDKERLGALVEDWVQSAPDLGDLDAAVTLDAQNALVEAGMVQYNSAGWDFKLHEKYPDAPRAQFKLMIRQAPGVDTNPSYYDRFTLPSVLRTHQSGRLGIVNYVVGYPNAGTPIAEAFVRLANQRFGIDLSQLKQAKIINPDGTRQLGDITSHCDKAELTLAIDDTATGGDSKIEGWQKIIEHGLNYAGLVLIVERDPLSTALIRQRTGEEVYPSIHWLTLVKYAGRVLDLPRSAIKRELDYPLRLFEWNAANHNLGSLPSLDS